MKLPFTIQRTIIMLIIAAGLLFSAGFMKSSGIIEKIKKKLASYNHDHLTERIYLHLDKDRVLPGELLWFKAYRINPNPGIIKDKSKILTLELWDSEGGQKLKRYFKIEEGSASGSLTLPNSLPPSDYILTAYTEQMKSRGINSYYRRPLFVREQRHELFFDLACRDSLYTPASEARVRMEIFNDLDQPLKNIPVSYRVEASGKKVAKGKGRTGKGGLLEAAFTIPEDPSRQPVILQAQTEARGHQKQRKLVIPTTTLDLNLQFFPESGNLIAGIPSRVAFKATDGLGNPVDVEGELLDKEGQVLDRVKSHFAGIGVFRVDSQKQGLQVRVTKPFRMKKTYSLPEPLEEGCQILVTKKDTGSLQLKVSASKSFAGKELILVATMNGEVRWSKSFTAHGEKVLAIPTGDLPMGVLTLTVFDSRLLPLAERPVFINRHKRLFVKLEADTTLFRKKQKVTLDITVTDHKGNPSPANLSLTVSDRSRLYDPPHTLTLLSHHYLKDAVRGRIHRPNAYFAPTPQSDTALDHLLMSQGWRHYKWKKILSYNPKEKREEQPFLTGRILRRKGKGARNATVELFTPRFDIKQEMLIKLLNSEHTPVQLRNPQYFRYVKLTTDRKGYFEITSTQFKQVIDTGSVLVRATKRDGSPEVLFRFPLEETDEQVKKLSSMVKPKERIQPAFALKSLTRKGQTRPKKDRHYPDFRERLYRIAQTNVSTRPKFQFPNEFRKTSDPNMEKVEKKRERRTSGITSYEELIKHISAHAAIDDGRIFLRGANWLCNVVPATIIIDDFPIGTRIRTIADRLNYNQVQNVQIINNPGAAARYVSGEKAKGGVIIIETGDELEWGAIRARKDQFKDLITIEGYQVPKEFYSPQYSSKGKKLNQLDMRKTLYWNPSVQIDATGKGRITFYTSNVAMKLLCTANGRNGRKLGSTREEFVVY